MSGTIPDGEMHHNTIGPSPFGLNEAFDAMLAKARQQERARCIAGLQAYHATVPKKRDAHGVLNREWTQYDQGIDDGIDMSIQKLEARDG